MKMKTLITAAVAGAFAMPLAAQVSADNDRLILAQATGSPGGPGAQMPATSFTKLDRNSDGNITREEMLDDPRVTEFDKMDADRDGRLSRNELEAGSAAAGASQDPSPDRVGELGRPGTTGGRAGWPPTNIQLLDKDKDEHISREEAGGDREVMSRFDQLDANNDGRLSRSEWEAGTAATGGTTK